jgi:4'-phosphopantetheinyl transferase
VDGADVLVVWLDLSRARDGAAAPLATLSAEERARVAKLATAPLQRRAAVRLALRRDVLGALLGVPASSVELTTDERGRLSVAGPTQLAVSSSSSGDVGLLAVASRRQVGADVASTGEVHDVPGFARRVATPRESAALGALGAEARRDALARLWTRKEAYLKATGEGISEGVAHVEVPLEEGLWQAPFAPVPGGVRWLLYDLACPVAGFAAALVVEPVGTQPPQVVLERR